MFFSCYTTTLRINLAKPEGRKAWAYLKNRNKSRYRSYSDAIIAAVNGYFDREKQLANDPYLETREKEDAFLQRVLETVQQAKHRLEEAEARDRVKERKARTRRLIQEGAVLEKVFPLAMGMDLTKLEDVLREHFS